MTDFSSKYVQTLHFTNVNPDWIAWEARLLEIGLDRESFCISNSEDGSATVEFWEPDKIEALRVLARLERIQ
jgi:hypothetical protein